MRNLFRLMRIGDKVVCRTASTKLRGGILHAAEVIDISLYRGFTKVRYLENQQCEEWLSIWDVERI